MSRRSRSNPRTTPQSPAQHAHIWQDSLDNLAMALTQQVRESMDVRTGPVHAYTTDRRAKAGARDQGYVTRDI